MRPRGRVVDPRTPIDRQSLAVMDVDTQREIRERDRVMDREERPDTIVISSNLGPWFGVDIGASGNASYQGRLMSPTAAATFGSTSAPGYRMAADGEIVRVYLNSNIAWTTGIVYPRITVTDGAGVLTAYDITDCALDGATHPDGYARKIAAAARMSIGSGISYSAGYLVDVVFRTASSFGPTTADMTVTLVTAELEQVSR